MYTLAVDSSRFFGSVALTRDGQPLMGISFNVKATYSEKLLQMISFLLDESQVELKNLGLIAVVEGPGSFTGLRIGMTLSKSLAYAMDIPLCGVNALEALAQTYAFGDGCYAPLFDARKGQVFAALYEMRSRSLSELIPPGSYHPERFFREAQKKGGRALFLGEGETFRETIESVFSRKETYISSHTHIDPFAVARLGMRLFEERGGDDLLTKEPAYYRASDAEINYEKNHPSS